MSGEDRSRPAGDAEPPSLAAIPYIERTLDDLYEALGEHQFADALIQAKVSLRARDYGKAMQLIEATSRRCMPIVPAGRRKSAIPWGGVAVTVEVLSGFNTMLRLLRPLSDWHQKQTANQKGADGQAEPAGTRRRTAGKSGRNAPGRDTANDSRQQTKDYLKPLLERRVFHQLFVAARRCILVPNPDMIMAVCDREVYDGRYQKAFEMIEGMYVQFNAQASQRQEDLRREAIKYKAGKLKIPPKDWLLRQKKVAEQNHDIERTRLYFTRVLDTLRAIRLADSK